MKKIVSKEQLSEEVFKMTFEAPYIAEGRKPGQFLILQLDNNYGERIPLTIAGPARPKRWTMPRKRESSSIFSVTPWKSWEMKRVR
jgi:NAD(P)H-flavin reductase